MEVIGQDVVEMEVLGEVLWRIPTTSQEPDILTKTDMYKDIVELLDLVVTMEVAVEEALAELPPLYQAAAALVEMVVSAYQAI